MQNIYTKVINGYELLDSGLGQKLEIIAGRTVIRACPQAIWYPRLKKEEWAKAVSINHRTKDGGGTWEHKTELKDDLAINWQELNLNIQFTSFGHCGLFFEQEPIWKILNSKTTEFVKNSNRPIKALNLFGYTGAATLAMAKAGAQVFHVDSAKGVLKWGERNARASKGNLDIKWVQEDAMKFVTHSVKKGFTYDLILADPPSWGHGANKELWEYNDHIHLLAENLNKILTKEQGLLILVSHTHGVQHEALKNLLSTYPHKNLEAGELGIFHKNDSRILPAGIFAKLER